MNYPNDQIKPTLAKRIENLEEEQRFLRKEYHRLIRLVESQRGIVEAATVWAEHPQSDYAGVRLLTSVQAYEQREGTTDDNT